MITCLIVIIFLLGLCVGSFLNSVIYRLKTEESILISRSHCPYCQHLLGFWDLIPLFSFIFLRGRCRYCKKRISWQYPLVELASGILFVLFSLKILSFELSALFFQLSKLILPLFFVSLLIIIFVYDLKWSLIPDKIVWLGITIALLALFFQFPRLFSHLLAGGLAGGFFLLMVLVSGEKWMGWGDVKLGLLMGLILGWPDVLIALFLSFIFGALVGITLVLAKKKTLKSQIPFGPFLSGATIIVLLVGKELLNWYFGLLGI